MQSRTMEIKITFVYFKQAQQELQEKERGILEKRKSFMKNHITCLNEYYNTRTNIYTYIVLSV